MVAQHDDTQAKYLALADVLRARIEGGVTGYEVGAVLPKHTELAVSHGVSKEAAADAVRHLEGEGLVRSVRRTGTVVLPRGRRTLVRPAQGTDDHALDHEWTVVAMPTIRGWQPQVDWLVNPVGPIDAVALFGRDAADLHWERRLLGVDGRVEQILTVGRPSTGDEGQPLRWDEVVSARMPTPDEAKVLAAPSRFPLLRVLRIGRSDDGGVRVCAELLVTAQRYEVGYLAPVAHVSKARAGSE